MGHHHPSQVAGAVGTAYQDVLLVVLWHELLSWPGNASSLKQSLQSY